MAEISKTGVPSPSNPLAVSDNSITGLKAGEAIAAGDACYVKASDGLVYKATGAAANAAAKVRGFAAKAADAGFAVTLLTKGVHIAYGPNTSGTSTAAGTDLYLSGTVAGGLADAASTGGTVPVAWVIDTDGRIMVL